MWLANPWIKEVYTTKIAVDVNIDVNDEGRTFDFSLSRYISFLPSKMTI
jgi:hypothetical protein